MNKESFNGFYPKTFEFMQKLKKNNSKKWFDKHRNEYEKYLLEPSINFVNSIKEFFQYVNPSIVAEPKFNKSFVRINKDMRFAKKPYKDYFLMRFGKVKWDSELYLVINTDGIYTGLFINNGKGVGSLFNKNMKSNPDLFLQYCQKYSVGKSYDIYELMKMERRIKGYVPERDFEKLTKINYFLFRKEYPINKKILYSKRFLKEIFKIYNQLYPVYLFATSENLEKDLKEYDNKLGVVKIQK
jgi:uncharacterized protein (TIGR02453 family)